MLHAKIIDSSIEKIEMSKAEHFLKSEKFIKSPFIDFIEKSKNVFS